MDGKHARPGPSASRQYGQTYYAAQAAADVLGIHRSTLYLAVKHRKLIPDAVTPGGHARFALETLERFRDRLALDSATGGDGAIARAVASTVSSLLHFPDLKSVCDAVADAALTACPAFDTCILVARDDESPVHAKLRLLAQRGMPERMALEYSYLRRQPGVDFITAWVSRQRAAFICSDVLAPDVDVPQGGLHTLSGSGFRSCAVLPCIWNGIALGILICLGRSPFDISEAESLALTTLADTLTVALRRERRELATSRHAETIALLMDTLRASPTGAPGPDPLRDVRGACQRGAHACAIGEWGFAEASRSPAPLAELLHAAAATDTPQRKDWVDDTVSKTALAIPVALRDGVVAVGAVWRRQDLPVGIDETLLRVYAQVCATIVAD